MLPLTPAAQHAVQELAQRYGVSVDAVTTLLSAVSLGNGSMAQFYHQELGGGGQWMRGGMTMVGDMFNGRLQSVVSGLCSELSSLLAAQQMFVAAPQQPGGLAPAQSWWPAELGQPSSSGGQNDARYAYFPGARRLAVSRGGQVTIYDTLDHQIGGVQQQQGGPYGSQSFTSQFGTFTVESLPIANASATSQSWSASASSSFEPAPAPPPGSTPPPSPPGQASDSQLDAPSARDIISQIERLAQLHQRGILSDDEFRSKKAELLSRL